MTIIAFTVGKSSVASLENLVAAGGDIARLTFSFGSNETQLRRAKELVEISRACGRSLKIAAELEGQILRVGRITDNGFEEEIPITAGTMVEFRDNATVSLDKNEKFVPVPGILKSNLSIGDKIVYGDHKCTFEVLRVLDDRILTIPQNSDEITSTRSISISGSTVPSMKLDQKNLDQLDFILTRNEFDIIILPGVCDVSIISAVKQRLDNAHRKIYLACRVGSKVDPKFWKLALEICEYIILDRSDMALAHGRYSVPVIVKNIMSENSKHRSKILIGSQVAQSASRGSTGQMSSSEISDAWTHLETGIGGFLLTEETAVDGNGISALKQLSELVDFFAKRRND